MMLVSALMGVQRVKDIYARAIGEKYRFFSYGDSSSAAGGAKPAECRTQGVTSLRLPSMGGLGRTRN